MAISKNCILVYWLVYFCYFLGVFFYAIACQSWLVHIWHQGKWRVGYENIVNEGAGSGYELFHSWDQRPFVDAIITDEALCPSTHPEDLIWDMWPGSVGFCDCLEREKDRQYYLNQKCDTGG